MQYGIGQVDFEFNEGTVLVIVEGNLLIQKEIGFDTSWNDFKDWCQYYVESKEFESLLLK